MLSTEPVGNLEHHLKTGNPPNLEQEEQQNMLFPQPKQDDRDQRDSAQKSAQDGKLSTTKSDEIGSMF